jgi:hypothetical protein
MAIVEQTQMQGIAWRRAIFALILYKDIQTKTAY